MMQTFIRTLKKRTHGRHSKIAFLTVGLSLLFGVIANPVLAQTTQEFSEFSLTNFNLQTREGDNNDIAKLKGQFTLGPETNGIDPLNEDIVALVGPLSFTVPAGSLVQDGNNFRFKDTIAGANVKVKLKPRDNASFTFVFRVKSFDFDGVEANEFRLTIGDDTGLTPIAIDFGGNPFPFPPIFNPFDGGLPFVPGDTGIGGQYQGEGVLTLDGCVDPLNDGTEVVSVSLTVSSSAESGFVARGSVNGERNFVLVHMTGSVMDDGVVEWPLTFINLFSGAAGSGMFVGQVEGTTLSGTMTAQTEVGGSCAGVAEVSLERVDPS